MGKFDQFKINAREDDNNFNEVTVQKTGVLDTIGKVGAQGLSFGFSDEAAGVGAAIQEFVSPRLGVGEDATFLEGLKERVKGMGQAFREGKGEELADVAKARKDRPILSTVADIGGATIASFAPIGLAGKLAKTIPAIGKFAGGARSAADVLKSTKAVSTIAAAEGGLRTLGEEERLTASTPLRVGAGAVIGGAAGFSAKRVGDFVAGKISARTAGQASEAIEAATHADDALGPIVPKVRPASEVLEETVKKADDAIDAAKARVAAPTPSGDEGVIAKLAQREPGDVAYFKANKGRIEATPSLNENSPNPMSATFAEDFIKLETRLSAREAAADALIEESGIRMSTRDLRGIWEKGIRAIRSSGKGFTPEGQAAIRDLKKAKALLPKQEQFMDGRTLRQYVQGLRDSNKAFFAKRANPVASPTLPEVEFGRTTEKINKMLGDQIPGYRDLMKQYSREVRSKVAITKMTGNVQNWFKNRVVKPIADAVDGTATSKRLSKEAKNWFSDIIEFGDIVGRDYTTMVKDRLIFGRMFPDQAVGGDLGPLTNRIGSFARNILTARPGRAAADVAITAARGKDVAAEKVLQDFLLKGETLATKTALGANAATKVVTGGAKSVVRGVGNVRRGTGVAIRQAGLGVAGAESGPSSLADRIKEQ